VGRELRGDGEVVIIEDGLKRIKERDWVITFVNEFFFKPRD
jgi:hypothetical protein